MAITNISFDEKLKKLEDKKQELLNQRRKEILGIIEATGSISINDQLLAGILLFLKDEKNKNHSILKEIDNYSNKLPKTRKNK